MKKYLEIYEDNLDLLLLLIYLNLSFLLNSLALKKRILIVSNNDNIILFFID